MIFIEFADNLYVNMQKIETIDTEEQTIVVNGHTYHFADEPFLFVIKQIEKAGVVLPFKISIEE